MKTKGVASKTPRITKHNFLVSSKNQDWKVLLTYFMFLIQALYTLQVIFFSLKKVFILYVRVCFSCIYVCAPCACLVPEEALKTVSDSPEQELEETVSCHVDAEN